MSESQQGIGGSGKQAKSQLPIAGQSSRGGWGSGRVSRHYYRSSNDGRGHDGLGGDGGGHGVHNSGGRDDGRGHGVHNRGQGGNQLNQRRGSHDGRQEHGGRHVGGDVGVAGQHRVQGGEGHNDVLVTIAGVAWRSGGGGRVVADGIVSAGLVGTGDDGVVVLGQGVVGGDVVVDSAAPPVDGRAVGGVFAHLGLVLTPDGAVLSGDGVMEVPGRHAQGHTRGGVLVYACKEEKGKGRSNATASRPRPHAGVQSRFLSCSPSNAQRHRPFSVALTDPHAIWGGDIGIGLTVQVQGAVVAEVLDVPGALEAEQGEAARDIQRVRGRIVAGDGLRSIDTSGIGGGHRGAGSLQGLDEGRRSPVSWRSKTVLIRAKLSCNFYFVPCGQ